VLFAIHVNETANGATGGVVNTGHAACADRDECLLLGVYGRRAHPESNSSCHREGGKVLFQFHDYSLLLFVLLFAP
jgi:hypothetical protein